MATRVASIVADIGINTGKFDKGVQSVLKSLGLMKGDFAKLGMAVGAASIVFGTIATQVKKAVDITVTYADQVRTLSSVTNQSTEDTSRMIQVLDDYKLSSEQAGSAARFLAREGLSLNIETLAKLSDEYKALNTGQERAEFLMKKFGKAGQDFALIMEEGSDKIKQRGEFVKKGLILTEKQLKQARDLEIAQDDLNDTIQEYNVIVGNEVIPLQIQWAKAWISLADGSVKLRNALDYIIAAPIDSATQSYIAWADAIGLIIPELEGVASATEDVSSDFDAIMSFSEGYTSHQETMKGLEEELATARERGYKDWGSKIKGIQGDIDAEKAEQQEWTNQFIYNMAQMQASADGLDPTEAAGLLAMATQLGIIDESAVSAYDDLMKLNGLDIESTVTTTYRKIMDEKTYNVGGDRGRTNRAAGGPRGAGYTLVGEAGPELISPSGMVINAHNTRRILNRGWGGRRMVAGGVLYDESDDPTSGWNVTGSGWEPDAGSVFWAPGGGGMYSPGGPGVGDYSAPRSGGGGGGGAVVHMVASAIRASVSATRESSQLVSAMERMLRQKSTVSAPVVSLSADTIRQMASAFAGEVKRSMG